MPETIQTSAIIIDRTVYGDQDWILSLLTRSAGLISVIARSSRSSRHRFAGALDLFVVFEAQIKITSRSSLGSLTEAYPQKVFPGVFDTLERLETGQVFLAVVRDLVRDAPVDSATFDLVEEHLTLLDCAHPEELHVILFKGVAALLENMGMGSVDGACMACSAALDGTNRPVMLEDGHITCDSCANLTIRRSVGRYSKIIDPLEETPAETFAFLDDWLARVLGRPCRPLRNLVH